MNDTYFARLKTETPTRVWVNNPTLEEIDLALAQGAVGCTTNPAYCARLLEVEADRIGPAIGRAAHEFDDVAVAAEHVQLAMVAQIVERFAPLFEASSGSAGFVSIQGSPEGDAHASRIEAEAVRGHALGLNATPKIPATAAGLEAFEDLVAAGYPTIVTEVFSLAQLIETNERYLSVAARTGARPPLYMSPITGIFGDHLKAVAVANGIEIARPLIELVGVILTRACYRVCLERDYPAILLAGGARAPFDLTGLVGGALHATINWSTFAEIMHREGPLGSIADPIDPGVVATLESTFPTVRAALQPDGLTVDEFASFPPVLFFRDKFMAGWRGLETAVSEARDRG